MAIFTIEAILKIIAMKSAYFKEGWNVFDFIVVICTIVALIVANIPGLKVDLSQQATMMRILRILRLLRMFKRAEKLKIISETIMTALPALASLGALLFLFIFLFTVIGV
jgi:voltage-gated sodium channel type V alpha